MPIPVKAALPPDLDLADGWQIRITAVDPTTGATVPNVNISNVSFEVELVSGTPEDLLGPFMVVPGPGA